MTLIPPSAWRAPWRSAQMGDVAAVPALQQAMRTESFPSAKSSMSETLDKLRAGGAVKAADPRAGVEKAQYVVQLGTMRNNTGQRADLDNVMRSTARTKAGSIKNAVILDNPDAAILRRAGERKIPVLLVDANLTRLSQTTGKDGGLIVSAQVDLSIIRVPGQTLKGTVSGKASASDDARNTNKGITELQNRAVNGAIESAMSSVGSENRCAREVKRRESLRREELGAGRADGARTRRFGSSWLPTLTRR